MIVACSDGLCFSLRLVSAEFVFELVREWDSAQSSLCLFVAFECKHRRRQLVRVKKIRVTASRELDDFIHPHEIILMMSLCFSIVLSNIAHPIACSFLQGHRHVVWCRDIISNMWWCFRAHASLFLMASSMSGGQPSLFTSSWSSDVRPFTAISVA